MKCKLTVNLEKTHRSDETPAAPMTITISMDNRIHHKPTFSPDLGGACEKIQELLLEFMDFINDDGSKGKMLFEVASSCGGESTRHSIVARAKDPSGSGDIIYLSVVELPFEYRMGMRSFHAKFLLRHQFLVSVKSLGCWMRLCGDEFHVPLKYSEPHVVVTGKRWEDVDQAVNLVKTAIGKHMDGGCTCTLA